ncbi:UspA [Plasmopara halstedii]|uniref:UspA n=1 Tax=Plasmopara halstedii TaxID=4781 RepID=A0A0P1AIJ1_PLAHL|nr:UspA [Plasmopara halstedii]CEG40567.1 UspA [Plasmopara halstedii]|eukprot:XP_024576936.1 UspA [Plasmopara halstedii]
MRNVLARKKISPALQLCIQAVQIILSIKELELTDETFQNFLDRPDEILALVRTLVPNDLSEDKHEQLCGLMDNHDYDSIIAARESESSLFLDFHSKLVELRNEMVQAHQNNNRLLPTTRFIVGVDGSRQSYVAFEIAVQLRRQGSVVAVYVDEENAASRQLPQIPKEFLTEEVNTHCKRLRLPINSFKLLCEKCEATTLVAQHLLTIADREHVDFLVVGAHGIGGPAIDQVHHVPWDILYCAANTPTIVVSPASITSVISKRYTFVLAVDKSTIAARCLNATLKLMRPVDILRIVHFYEKPIVGEYDAQPFEWYKGSIAGAGIEGVLDLQPFERTTTVAESLQDYLSTHSAAYLILGINGEGAETFSNSVSADNEAVTGKKNEGNRIGRLASAMLFSPRCTLCFCS